MFPIPKGPTPRSELLHRATDLPPKDFWRTPQWLFDLLDSEFGPFDLDAAATPTDARCDAFLTVLDNALTIDWSSRGSRVFVNPPYSRAGGDGEGLLAWVQAAVRARDAGAVVVMVAPPALSTRYHQVLKSEAIELLHLPRRVPFLDPDTGEPRKGNRGDTMVAVLIPDERGPAVERYLQIVA